MFKWILRKAADLSAVSRKRQSLLAAVNDLESEVAFSTDEGLAARARDLRLRVRNGDSTSALIAEAYALVREASKRTLGQRHHDVQILGGIVLQEGRIAEMQTGEGKTLVAALPTFLEALSGNGVHVITANDYLARRDMEVIGRVHRFLGLSVGLIIPGISDLERRAAYACDVTYAVSSEIGFDYLKDNMRFDVSQKVQRGHHFAILDEADSILIDEARTPLIISGPAEDRVDLYSVMDRIVARLGSAHVAVDERTRSAVLTEEGVQTIERLLQDEGLIQENGGLYDLPNADLVEHVGLALKARHIFQRDKDYIVRGDEVLIVDEHTGRGMIGRRYSDGIHQAIEAKEKVTIKPETATLASITYQSLFRMYGKLAGMTGTAMTERDELAEIYGLDVVAIPTHRPVIRKDDPDEIHLTERSKYTAIVKEIVRAHGCGQPVLVGTTSVERSERLAAMLEELGFVRSDAGADPGVGTGRFHVLNAKNHEAEAYIVSQAGLPGAITIATNMAGRGTDIQLGGNAEALIADELGGTLDDPEKSVKADMIRDKVAAMREQVIAVGGLLVIGTERHESRRIDNQLRGRAGRQGDPGRSIFFVSLEDDVVRVHGGDRLKKLARRLGLQEGMAISHPLIARMLERAQKRVEAANFSIRKDLIRYDEVYEGQRSAIYGFRNELASREDVREWLRSAREEVIHDILDRRMPEQSLPEQWDFDGLRTDVSATFGIELKDEQVEDPDAVVELIDQMVGEKLSEVETDLGSQLMRRAEKSVLLACLDRVWHQHMAALDGLKSVIGLRGYGHRNPIEEYRTEAFVMFESMMKEYRIQVSKAAMTIHAVKKALKAA